MARGGEHSLQLGNVAPRAGSLRGDAGKGYQGGSRGHGPTAITVVHLSARQPGRAGSWALGSRLEPGVLSRCRG